MRVLAPRFAHAGRSTQLPINVSENFPVRGPAESLLNSSNLSKVVSKDLKFYGKPLWYFSEKLPHFPHTIAIFRGHGFGGPWLKSLYYCYLGAHKRIRYRMMSPSGIYWNPNIFVSEEPMQNFVTPAVFFLVEMKGPLKKKERRDKWPFNICTNSHEQRTHSLWPKNRDDYKQVFWNFFKTNPPQLLSIIEADH